MPIFDGITKKMQSAIQSITPKALTVSEADIKKRLANGEEIVMSITQAKPVYPQTVVLTNQRIMVFQDSVTKSVFKDFYFRDMKNVIFRTNMSGGILTLEADIGNNEGIFEISSLPLEESKTFYSHLQAIERDWFEKKRNMKLEEERAKSGGSQIMMTTASPAQNIPVTVDKNDEIETKLLKLKTMFDKGLVSEEEYSSKRQSLIDQL